MSSPPQSIIVVPVHTPLWPALPVGAPVVLSDAQASVPGL